MRLSVKAALLVGGTLLAGFLACMTWMARRLRTF